MHSAEILHCVQNDERRIAVIKKLTKVNGEQVKNRQLLARLTIFLGVPAGSRTRNYALGGRRYIHLTTETRVVVFGNGLILLYLRRVVKAIDGRIFSWRCF